ncbi:MAG: methionyl-tRNA formyltransferase [Alphaproteobacteria bacterium]|nr:methionyl-tRNA formyltransferase [Alphaproteobacteria bacterium]
MRVIFMGTPAFAVPALAALLASAHAVVAVYSQPPRPAGRGLKLTPSPVQQLAEKHGIPVYTPASLKPADIQAAFAAHRADIAVVAAYGLLLPQAVLDAPRLGCINIHPSDLPRWRGAAPLQRTLMAGDTQTASCIIQLEAGLDTGPIHLREAFAIPPEMDAGGLHDALAHLGARQVLSLLERLASPHPPAPTPQRAEGILYAEKISKADREIDWSRPAAQLIARIRGLSPAPAATTQLNGETIKVFKAEAAPGDARQPAGTVLDDQLCINAGNGTALRLTELQRAGKSRQQAAQFLQGFPVPAGSCAQKSGS